MNKYLKREDLTRKLRSLWRHAVLLSQPFFAAVVAIAMWISLHNRGIHFPREDEIALTAVGVAVPAVLFSILAALLITASYERYQKLTACLLTKDRGTFLLYRDERFPVIMHVLQMALSLPIIAIAMGLHYGSRFSGVVVVFAVTFVITLYWVAIAELQNPADSPWFAERIPEDWLAADVDTLLPIPEKGE